MKLSKFSVLMSLICFLFLVDPISGQEIRYDISATANLTSLGGGLGPSAALEIAFPIWLFSSNDGLDIIGLKLFGAATMTSLTGRNSADTATSFNVGAGIEMPLISLFRIQVGYRYQYLSNAFNGAEGDTNVTTAPETENGFFPSFAVGFDLGTGDFRLLFMGDVILSPQGTVSLQAGCAFRLKYYTVDGLFSDDLDAVQRALSNTFNGVNSRNSKGETPLHHALEAGNTEIAAVLISKGGKMEDGSSGLVLATVLDSPTVQDLLSSGADVNQPDAGGKTPLQAAVETGNYAVAVPLLSRGATADNELLTKLAKVALEQNDSQSTGLLDEIKKAQAIDPLIACLKDPDAAVRSGAAQALGDLRNVRALAALIICLKDTEARVRSSAAQALGGLHDAGAVDPLIARLQDPDAGVRSSAVKALGGLHVPTSILTYDANGAESGRAPKDVQKYYRSQPVTILGVGDLEKSGFAFAGWNTQADGKGTPFAPKDSLEIGAANMTLYAVWKPLPTYALLYDANGAESGVAPVDAERHYERQQVTVPDSADLEKSGFVFAGWNTRADGKGTNFAPGQTMLASGADTMLYAVWKFGRQTVTYNANGATSGGVPGDAKPHYQGQTLSVLDSGNLAKGGFSFTGWNTQADGKGTAYTPQQTLTVGSSSITLFAVWQVSDAAGLLATAKAVRVQVSQSYTKEGKVYVDSIPLADLVTRILRYTGIPVSTGTAIKTGTLLVSIDLEGIAEDASYDVGIYRSLDVYSGASVSGTADFSIGEIAFSIPFSGEEPPPSEITVTTDWTGVSVQTVPVVPFEEAFFRSDFVSRVLATVGEARGSGPIINALSDTDARVRLAAIDELVALGDKTSAVKAALSRALKDNTDEVKAAAQEALEEINGSSSSGQ